MTPTPHAFTATHPEFTVAENPRVSAHSFFQDEVWDFSLEQGGSTVRRVGDTIRWDLQIKGDTSLCEPEYSSMLLALKQLAYVMLFGSKRNNSATEFKRLNYMRLFIAFLADRPNPVYRFQDVLESDMRDFVEHFKKRPGKGGKGKNSTSTLGGMLVFLNSLYDERDYLVDHLTFRPSGKRSGHEAAGYKRGDLLSGRYQPIPDEELRELISTSLDYIQNLAPLMFKRLEDLDRFISDNNLQKLSRSRQRCILEEQFFPLDENFKSSSQLNSALLSLRSACFIVIAFSTGMRLSEITAMKVGCVREEITSNHGKFYWIDSKLYKTQKMRAGTDRSWMCGALAAQAVRVLEQMRDAMGVISKSQSLFFSFYHFINVKRSSGSNIRQVSDSLISLDLKKFCSDHNLGTHLHPHRFRRSFAKNIIRFSSTSILALKDHFKHWSLYMTDWYVGLDPDLIEELEAERLLLSIEATDKLCTQTASGPGGRRWTRELEERIRDGTLPRNFRGRAGAEFRKKMIQGVHESGMLITPCGDFTYCVFQKDRALCTKGDHPVPNRCNPLDCANSFILAENVPAYKKQLAELERHYGSLSAEEAEGPVGLFYANQIRRINKIIGAFKGD